MFITLAQAKEQDLVTLEQAIDIAFPEYKGILVWPEIHKFKEISAAYPTLRVQVAKDGTLEEYVEDCVYQEKNLIPRNKIDEAFPPEIVRRSLLKTYWDNDAETVSMRREVKRLNTRLAKLDKMIEDNNWTNGQVSKRMKAMGWL